MYTKATLKVLIGLFLYIHTKYVAIVTKRKRITGYQLEGSMEGVGWKKENKQMCYNFILIKIKTI